MNKNTLIALLSGSLLSPAVARADVVPTGPVLIWSLVIALGLGVGIIALIAWLVIRSIKKTQQKKKKTKGKQNEKTNI